MTRRGHGPAGPDLVGAGLIVVAAACFGTLGPLSRFATDAGVDSLTMVTWRAAIGGLVVTAFIGLRLLALGIRPVSVRSLPARDRWFMVAAAGANTILNLSAFIAFERIEIALTLLVFYLYPAGVALASAIWFGDRLDKLRWAALGISLVGMALVVAGAGSLGEVDGLGIGLAFVAALAQVFYVLAARHGFARIPGPQAAALTMLGAASLYLLIGAHRRIDRGPPTAACLLRSDRAGAAGGRRRGRDPDAGIHPRIRRLGAPRAAILATLEPIIGVGLAAWLLAEQPAPIQVAGGALILAAAVILQLGPRSAVADHEAVEAVDVQPRT